MSGVVLTVGWQRPQFTVRIGSTTEPLRPDAFCLVRADRSTVRMPPTAFAETATSSNYGSTSPSDRASGALTPGRWQLRGDGRGRRRGSSGVRCGHGSTSPRPPGHSPSRRALIASRLCRRRPTAASSWTSRWRSPRRRDARASAVDLAGRDGRSWTVRAGRDSSSRRCGPSGVVPVDGSCSCPAARPPSLGT